MSEQTNHNSTSAAQTSTTSQEFISLRLENSDADVLRQLTENYDIGDECGSTSLEGLKTGTWDEGHWANRK